MADNEYQVKQTETEVDNGEVVSEHQRVKTTSTASAADPKTTTQNVAYYVLGVIEVLLGLRFILKLLGANPASGFVDFVYTLTGVLVAPFEAIFSVATTEGAETTSVFEPATLIAALVYALIVYGIVKLVNVNQKR